MIPVSTSVLMVLLKPLQVLSAAQRVFGFGPRKGKRMSLQSLSFNDFMVNFSCSNLLRLYDA